MTKKLLLSILLAGAIFTLHAQDVIIKENGEEIKAKVTEVGSSEIKYKKFGNESGPTYTISKSELFLIKYADGSKEIMPVTSPVQSTAPAVVPAPVLTSNSQSTTSQEMGKQEKHKSDAERKPNYFFLSLTPGGIKDYDDYFFDVRMGWTHNYSSYAGWDIFSLHLRTTANTIENIEETLSIQLMTGIRGYSPTFWRNKSAFGAFNIGVASNLQDITENTGLCYEIEIGASITRKFFAAFVYNHATSKDNGKIKFTGLRIGFHF